MHFYGREGTFTVEAYLFDGRGARVATASADVVASLPDATTDEPPDDTTDVPPDDTTDVPPDNTNDEPPTNNRVRLRTNLGDIVLEMLVDAAPGTVANFRQYVRDGHYNGVVFHRVVPNFVIQGGAFTSLGVGADPRLTEIGTRPPIASEANNGFSNVRGTVAMALRGQDADSGTDQFFINLVDNTFLDTGPPPFTVFARVVEGMLVVDRIGGVATGSFNVLTTNGPSTFEDVPVEDVTVLSATEE
jgi:cyclophilin family peptidyl-prolyl cis-trans isomerase